MKKRNLTDSFNDAITGFIQAVRSERNMRIHAITAIIVLIFALIFKISQAQVLVLILAITLVMATELINTALEAAVDASVSHYHPLVKIAKDTAAAAVFLSAMAAVVIGLIIFWQPVTSLSLNGLARLKALSPFVTFALIAIVSLVVILLKAKRGRGTPLRGGMPSGHAALGFSMATMVTYFTDNVVVISIAYLMAVLISQSRLDANIHGWMEIIAGALLGMLITIGLFQIVLKLAG